MYGGYDAPPCSWEGEKSVDRIYFFKKIIAGVSEAT